MAGHRIDPVETERIYRELRKGLGHELVTEDNVRSLMARAEQDGHAILVEELREWAAGCGAPRDRPRPGDPGSDGLH